MTLYDDTYNQVCESAKPIEESSISCYNNTEKNNSRNKRVAGYKYLVENGGLSGEGVFLSLPGDSWLTEQLMIKEGLAHGPDMILFDKDAGYPVPEGAKDCAPVLKTTLKELNKKLAKQ